MNWLLSECRRAPNLMPSSIKRFESTSREEARRPRSGRKFCASFRASRNSRRRKKKKKNPKAPRNPRRRWRSVGQPGNSTPIRKPQQKTPAKVPRLLRGHRPLKLQWAGELRNTDRLRAAEPSGHRGKKVAAASKVARLKQNV